MGFTTTTDPNDFGAARGVENANNLVLTFPVAASQSLSKGDFVTLNDTGLATKNATKEVAIDGIVMTDVDNSTGSAADKYAPILVKGVAEVDGYVEVSGSNYDADIDVGAEVIVGENSTSTGQVLVASDGTGVTTSNNNIGIALDAIDTPTSAATTRKLRVYIDRFTGTYTAWN